MAVRAGAPEPDFAKSTNAFPMDREPEVVYVDDGLDYAKSTGAFPMYDDRNARARTVEHIGAEVSPTFGTPGPVSAGVEQIALSQRQELGLSPELSGESDAGYEARPTTVVVPGADGVERQVVTHESRRTAGSDRVYPSDVVAVTSSTAGAGPDDAPATHTRDKAGVKAGERVAKK